MTAAFGDGKPIWIKVFSSSLADLSCSGSGCPSKNQNNRHPRPGDRVRRSHRPFDQGGVNLFRLNMSHAQHDWTRRITRSIREAAAAANCHTGIMMDTQGPAIRTGELPVALDLQPGQKFALTVRGERSEEERSVDVNYEGF